MGQCSAQQTDPQYVAPAKAVGKPSPNRRHNRRRHAVSHQNKSNVIGTATKLWRQEGQNGDDNAEPDQVDNNDKKHQPRQRLLADAFNEPGHDSVQRCVPATEISKRSSARATLWVMTASSVSGFA